MTEGRTLQHKLKTPPKKDSKNENNLARKFSHFMLQGKTSAALDLLANKGKGGVLTLDETADKNDPNSATVREVLASKHPPRQPASPEATLQGPAQEPSPILFERIDAHLIRSTALKVRGAAGQSGLDAYAL